MKTVETNFSLRFILLGVHGACTPLFLESLICLSWRVYCIFQTHNHALCVPVDACERMFACHSNALAYLILSLSVCVC